MVGYGWRSPLRFFNSNQTVDADLQAEVCNLLGLDQPTIVEETEAEEAKLMGDAQSCKHRCKDKMSCKHPCCKPSRSVKEAGNLDQLQYTCWILHQEVEPALKEVHTRHSKVTLLEDNDNSYGTRSLGNLPRAFKKYLMDCYDFEVL